MKELKFYRIEDRNLPPEVLPHIDQRNMGVHIMWMYHNGYKQRAILEMKDLLENYIKELVGIYSEPYDISEYDFEDLQQDALIEMMKRMEKYEPSKGMPTTYFKPYIRDKCYENLRNNKEHISGYYSKRAAQIRKAIAECEQKHIPYNDNKLAIMTGLSVHTIRQTMMQVKYCTDISLEELENTEASYMQTPEKIVMKKEESKIITSALDSLNEKERKILMMKVFDNEKNGNPITYKTIAEHMGESIDDVKKILNQAKLKLSQVPEMRQMFSSLYYDKKHKIKKKDVVFIPEDSACITARQVMESIKQDAFGEAVSNFQEWNFECEDE